MAIVRGQDGKFYDIDEGDLDGKEVKPEDLPEDAQPSGPGPAGGPPETESFGAGGIIQIFVNVPEGGGGGGGGGEGAPPPSGAAQGQGQEGQTADVQGHNYCGWRNCGWRNWRNWRNCGWRNGCY